MNIKLLKTEISRMEIELSKLSPLPLSSNGRDEKESRLTYACPLWKQYLLVTWRTIVEDWRTQTFIPNFSWWFRRHYSMGFPF